MGVYITRGKKVFEKTSKYDVSMSSGGLGFELSKFPSLNVVSKELEVLDDSTLIV